MGWGGGKARWPSGAFGMKPETGEQETGSAKGVVVVVDEVVFGGLGELKYRAV